MTKAMKGGRPSIGHTPKSAPMNLRTRPDVRAQIEAAAKASGRSLSEEAGLRVEQSFQNDLFSARGISAIRAVERRTGRNWLEDFDTFEAALSAIFYAIEGLRPQLPADLDKELSRLREALAQADRRLEKTDKLVRKKIPAFKVSDLTFGWKAMFDQGMTPWIKGTLFDFVSTHTLADAYLTEEQLTRFSELTADQLALARDHQNAARERFSAKKAYDKYRTEIQNRMLAARQLGERVIDQPELRLPPPVSNSGEI